MDTQVEPRDEMPISRPVPVRAEWAGAKKNKWDSGEPKTDEWIQWNTTIAKSWSDGKHTWRLVKCTLSGSKVVEEWHCGDEVRGA